MTTMMERSFKYLDERLGTASLARTALRKVFPDHWSFLLGEIALFALVVLIFTGTFLTFFYTRRSRRSSTTARTSRCGAPTSRPPTTRCCGCRSRSGRGC